MRRFLLVRLDGLGDALVCVPALEGLRRSFPDAEFGALCSPANADLFCRQRVHVHVIRDGEPEEPVVADVRSRHYTDAVVATEEPAGYRLARASGARRRAGFWHRFEKTFKSIWQYAQLTERVYRSAAWVAQPEHEVSAIYRLAEPLGAEKPIPDDPVRLRKWLDVDDSTSPVGKHAFAFQIAAKLRANDWNAPSVAAAALAALRGSHFSRCVFLASSADQELAREVLEHFERASSQTGMGLLAPSTGLRQWLGSLASSGALVTPDTGAAHAAGMLGVPVVDLFDSDRFEQHARQWRPWAAPSRCIVKPRFAEGAATQLGSAMAAALNELAQISGALR